MDGFRELLTGDAHADGVPVQRRDHGLRAPVDGEAHLGAAVAVLGARGRDIAGVLSLPPFLLLGAGAEPRLREPWPPPPLAEAEAASRSIPGQKTRLRGSAPVNTMALTRASADSRSKADTRDLIMVSVKALLAFGRSRRRIITRVAVAAVAGTCWKLISGSAVYVAYDSGCCG